MTITRGDCWGLTLILIASLLLKFADYEVEKLGRYIEHAACLRGHLLQECTSVKP